MQQNQHGRTFAIVLALLFLCSFGLAQNSAPGASSSSATSGASSRGSQNADLVIVSLVTPLDSKKLKPGAEVMAKALTEFSTGSATIPRLSKVVGHVTEATARSKGDANSSLTIVFDKLLLPGGESTPLKAAILALAPDPNQTSNDPAAHVEYTDRDALAYRPEVPRQMVVVPSLTEQSRGVLGLKNLQLGSDGALTSSGKDVKVDSGTQLLLAVQR